MLPQFNVSADKIPAPGQEAALGTPAMHEHAAARVPDDRTDRDDLAVALRLLEQSGEIAQLSYSSVIGRRPANPVSSSCHHEIRSPSPSFQHR